MAVDICFLLAAERSGTHMLRSVLEKVPGVKAPGEICNVASGTIRSSATSYLKFRAQACAADPNLLYPTKESQTRLLDGYLASIGDTMAGSALVVLDIKYSHVHNFSTFWWDIAARPFLLDFARKRKIRILHLVREKVYRTAISRAYAEESGVWRARRPEKILNRKIAVNLDELDDKVRRLVRNINMFDEWLKGIRHVRVTYEGLTTDPAPSLARLRSFLGLDGEIAFEPGFVKTTPPYEESIANFGELANLIDLDLNNLDAIANGARR